jgi:diguanylate cyclase (GGDEF)-like protein
VVLACLLLSVGLVALAFATLAPVPSSIDWLDRAVAAVASSAAVVALLAVPRWGRRVSLTLFGLVSVLVAGLVLARVTPQGQATIASLLTLAALFAAVYFTHRQMIVGVLAACALFVVGSTAGRGDLQAFYLCVSVVVVVLIAEVVSRLVARQRDLRAELREHALRDPLTGALNRRGAEVEAERVRGVVARAGGTTTVSVLDLDGFKGYNDSRGHPAGDELLIRLVRDWTAALRAGDVLARIGGDEFLVVLPQTDLEGAAVTLGRMRELNPFPWTVGTTVWQPAEDLFDAAARADDDLYVGKASRHVRGAGPPPD